MSVGQNGARAKKTELATRIPAHGNGRLMPPFQHGQAANPGGRPSTLKDVRRLARLEVVDAVHALVACYKTPSGKISRNADPRVVPAAVMGIVKLAFGEIPPYDPTQERPETTYDLSHLSLQERRMLLAAMDKGVVAISDADTEDDGLRFDPSRFEDAPTIEAIALDPSLAPEPDLPMMKPKPKKRPRKPGPNKAKGRPPGKKSVKKGAAAAKKAASGRAKRAQALRVDATATVEGPELPPKRPRLNLF